MTRLFISYAHLDHEVVLPEAEELKGLGHEVWIDTSGIPAGDSWPEEITVAIKACDVFLLFVSPHSAASDFVRREIGVAFKYQKRILPLYLEPIEIPESWTYQLVDIQYIDCRRRDWKVRLRAALSGEVSAEDETVEEQEPSVRARPGRKIKPPSTLPALQPITRALVFLNREEELQKALQFLEEHRLLLITGMPGIGKSVFARALVEFKQDKQAFWYDFSHRESSGNTLGVLLEHISAYLDFYLEMNVSADVMAFRKSQTDKASISDVEILLGYLNQEKPVWLVFDNLETVLSSETNGFLDEGLELLFNQLKNGTHNARIIVTNPFIPVFRTGENLPEAGTWATELQGLDDASGVAFLRKYGADDPEDRLIELVHNLSGHPYFLNDIAQDVVYIGAEDVLANLPDGLVEIKAQYASLLEKRLTPKEFSALQCLTLLNREMRLTDLCHITKSKPSVIIHLREHSLLQTDASGNFWVHNIVRTTIRPTDPDLIGQTHLRAMEFYRKQSRPILCQSIDDYSGVLEWHYHAIAVGDATSAYSAMYSTGLVSQLLDWDEYELLVKLCEQTLTAAYQIAADISSPVQANLSNAEKIRVHHSLGNACFLLSDYSKSITHFDTALQLLRSERDDELRIRLMIDLAEAYNGKRDLRSAMALADQLAVLLSTIENDALQAKFLHLRGIIHRDSGNLEEAVDDLEKALDLYERLDKTLHVGNARIDLGLVNYRMNRFIVAITEYQQALMAFESQHDIRGIIIARFNMAEIMLLRAQFQSAMEEIRPALDLARKRKFVNFEIMSSQLLVEAQITLGKLKESEQELELLGQSVEKKALSRFSGYELVLRAYLYSKKDQPGQAMNCFVQAFRILNDPGCEEEYARGSLLFATFLKQQGDVKRAEKILLKAKDMFSRINNQLGLQATKKMLQTITY